MPFTFAAYGITPDVDTVTPMLTEINARFIDLLPMYDALYTAFRKMEQARFNAEGPGWAPLAPSTVAQRGSSHPILNRTGALRRSLTTKGARGAVVQPMPDGVFFGTSNPVARYHQHGTHGAGRSHTVSMPARPVVDLGVADAQVFGGIIGEYLYGASVSSTVTGSGAAGFVPAAI